MLDIQGLPTEELIALFEADKISVNELNAELARPGRATEIAHKEQEQINNWLGENTPLVSNHRTRQARRHHRQRMTERAQRQALDHCMRTDCPTAWAEYRSFYFGSN